MNKSILLIVPHLGIGGQERIAAETAHMLQEAGNAVTIVVFEQVAKQYFCTAPIIDLRLPASSNWWTKLSRVLSRNHKLRALKKKNQFDAAYSFGDIANVSNALSCTKRERTILSIHGYSSVPRSITNKLFYRLLCRRADITVCVSAQISTDMAAATRLPSTCFRVLYNPYNIDQIRKAAYPAKVLEHPAFVTVGRLEPVKGYENLLAAFAEVAAQIPFAHLYFVGDGSLRLELERLAEFLHISSLVHFVGLQDNPFPWIAGADAFVLSSYSEGFPNAMIEAMACGLPIVSVDCPSGPNEILKVQHPITGLCKTPYGLLCPAFVAGDSMQATKQRLLAQAMQSLLEDQAYFSACREQVKQRALEFGTSQYLQELEQLL